MKNEVPIWTKSYVVIRDEHSVREGIS